MILGDTVCLLNTNIEIILDVEYTLLRWYNTSCFFSTTSLTVVIYYFYQKKKISVWFYYCSRSLESLFFMTGHCDHADDFN